MPKLDPFRSPQGRARFIAQYDAIVADWPVPCDEFDVETRFGATHVIASGPESAPPLVLLHGATATAVMWHSVMAPLSASHRCYCIDTITEPNKSALTRPARGTANLVEWLRQVFGALRIDDAAVAGMSYGGWLATNLAVQAPELVNRLILVAPAATLAPIPAEFFFRMFSTGLLRSRGLATRFVEWMASTPDIGTDPVADLIVTSLVSCRTLRFEVTPPTVFSDDSLRRIAAPTTLLIGEHEVVYRTGPRAAMDRAQSLISDVRTSLIPGANHMLTRDNPSALADAMVAALR
ncbi:Pimeloyl-ACP methyl ester carboxylesterase [Mycolicibacterium rutilum]|uniref:Pimeloyl-ACP methyl ester carboxylesterase n=1 Tax=Mycolicibacterium rutilum TaxID=370526 RepID=A0A1H6LH39_MYCRU|nr:alpha/beta hydrolase [Mycolicibacterium rutilum]SEH84086.1 Pimeloyl-ACP methyl ester carboxylesterase [Mycolicibacterium rutilum]